MSRVFLTMSITYWSFIRLQVQTEDRVSTDSFQTYLKKTFPKMLHSSIHRWLVSKVATVQAYPSEFASAVRSTACNVPAVRFLMFVLENIIYKSFSSNRQIPVNRNRVYLVDTTMEILSTGVKQTITSYTQSSCGYSSIHFQVFILGLSRQDFQVL